MTDNVHFSSETDDWSTPQDFYDKLNAKFAFTLDPCSSDSNHKTEKYFTTDDDGLSKSWDGERVFMNPPYGRQIGAWMKKASETDGLVVCLVPARVDTKWWHDYVVGGLGDVHFIKGRLKFGGSGNSAPFPSAIVIYWKTGVFNATKD